MKRKAFITGITGQDGSYLAEFLLEKGYEVYGLVRNVALEDSSHRMSRLTGIINDINLETGSVENYPKIYRLINTIKPDEIYHLAAQSFVSYNFDDEFSALNTNINGTHYLLSTVKELVPTSKFYFAGSSEMFGSVEESPQTEKTPFNPRSLYGISKVASFQLVKNYRDTCKLFAVSGILYNHESPRRGFEYVTRKITSHVAMIKKGLTDKLALGNIDARRDWGHAKDYVRAMWLMLQKTIPEDYVICSGETHTVREFCEKAFSLVNLDYNDYVVIDKRFYRPSESCTLQGNDSKAEKQLGWEKEISFDSLIREMVDNDLKYIERLPSK